MFPLFVHIPKTGGLSIREILEPLDHVRVINHNIRRDDYLYLHEFLAGKNRSDYYVFTMVRNPWDRLVSTFTYLNAGGDRTADAADRDKYIGAYQEDFAGFVKNQFQSGEIFNQIHFKEQWQWVCDSEGRLLTDEVLHFENFNTDLEKISDKINVDFSAVPHLNQSYHRPYRDMYTKETWDIVAQAYERDIEMFGYAATLEA